MTLYRSVDVWKRTRAGRLVRYRCFELLPAGGFCVQSADFYDARPSVTRAQLEQQFFELLSEEAPEVRSKPHPTLESAIQAHDIDFA
jgi:hypothetical protein